MTPTRVFLHVGSPKTGTTFLQEVLWSQRAEAERQGLLLPLDSFDDHFLGTVDVRDMAGMERFPPRALGMWDRIVESGLAWNGRVLVSHELFAGATAEQAARAVRAWGDVDLHVIVTARDLARQIPAEWQEHLKHRSTLTFAAFVEALRTHGAAAQWFWTVQDYAAVCRRWITAVPAAKVHVVTVPRAAADAGLLWERFASLLELDPAAFDVTVSRPNASLRAPQAELLRRVNEELEGRLLLPGEYATTVKEAFAQEVLAGRPGAPITLPPGDRDFAVRRSKELAADLEALGIQVVGDLFELIPDPAVGTGSTSPGEPPETIEDSAMMRESIESLAGLLHRFGDERTLALEAVHTQHGTKHELNALRAELAAVRADLDRARYLRQHRPLRSIAVGMSERYSSLMRLRERYWHAMELVRRLRDKVRSD
jgi:hypothetical protein